jgi:hypothetical protein
LKTLAAIRPLHGYGIARRSSWGTSEGNRRARTVAMVKRPLEAD